MTSCTGPGPVRPGRPPGHRTRRPSSDRHPCRRSPRPVTDQSARGEEAEARSSPTSSSAPPPRHRRGRRRGRDQRPVVRRSARAAAGASRPLACHRRVW